MAKKFLGSAPSGATDLMRKTDVDAVAYHFTVDDSTPTALSFGHRWVRPETGREAVWVPLVGGGGTWFTTGAGGGTGNLDDYLKNTTDTFTGTLTMAGSIIPSTDITYDLGSPTKMWRDLYVGPGSIYMNGKKILEDNSDTIVFSTDVNQNVRMEVTGSGNVEVKSENGGAILLQGTVNVSAGKKIVSSDGVAVEFGDDIQLGTNRIHSSAAPSGATDLTNKSYVDGLTTNDSTLVRTSGTQTINGDKTFGNNVVVSGNLTVNGTTTTVNSETVSVADNIIELNSNVTTGTPTENSGFLVRRGDLGVVQWIWDEANDRFTGITGLGVVQNIYVGNARVADLTVAGNTTFSGTVTGLTKATVGLSNVDNTSDAAKPVSDATASALNAKANSTNPIFSGTVTGVTKAHVGLPNVDNTADVDKPISTATQGALDAKAPKSSPILTGTPQAPTAAPGTATDQIATTAFAQAASAPKGGGTNRIFFENDQIITEDYTVGPNKNAGTFGPIQIASGKTVTVSSGCTWTIV